MEAHELFGDGHCGVGFIMVLMLVVHGIYITYEEGMAAIADTVFSSDFLEELWWDLLHWRYRQDVMRGERTRRQILMMTEAAAAALDPPREAPYTPTKVVVDTYYRLCQLKDVTAVTLYSTEGDMLTDSQVLDFQGQEEASVVAWLVNYHEHDTLAVLHKVRSRGMHGWWWQ